MRSRSAVVVTSATSITAPGRNPLRSFIWREMIVSRQMHADHPRSRAVRSGPSIWT